MSSIAERLFLFFGLVGETFLHRSLPATIILAGDPLRHVVEQRIHLALALAAAPWRCVKVARPSDHLAVLVLVVLLFVDKVLHVLKGSDIGLLPQVGDLFPDLVVTSLFVAFRVKGPIHARDSGLVRVTD